MSADVIIRVEDVKKYYNDGKVKALDGVSTEIRRGEVVVIIGPSGGGKSTLLRSLNLLEEPTEGKIFFEGADITDPKINIDLHRQKMGMVFQHFNLFPHMTILHNMTLAPIRVLKRSKQEAEAKAMELLARVGLQDKANNYPQQLSGGQKQRVALARTMVMKPRILLLDEPLSALDGVIKESIKEKIKEIAREFKLTTIIVTHDPEEALTLSDKVLIVNEGSIAQFGRPEEIIGQPADSFVKNFILNQLEVKRNNIFTLFSREMTRSSSQRISCTA